MHQNSLANEAEKKCAETKHDERSVAELAELTEDFPGRADGHELTVRAKDRGCDRRVMRCNDLW